MFHSLPFYDTLKMSNTTNNNIEELIEVVDNITQPKVNPLFKYVNIKPIWLIIIAMAWPLLSRHYMRWSVQDELWLSRLKELQSQVTTISWEVYQAHVNRTEQSKVVNQKKKELELAIEKNKEMSVNYYDKLTQLSWVQAQVQKINVAIHYMKQATLSTTWWDVTTPSVLSQPTTWTTLSWQESSD